ncbi:protein Cep78 homolog [Neocloeon triangulifer]|uniref:protein Cep78 homolog n=1 Tax=Neocloeon triangulifer TaxID=2078957 RepID=UPI00286F3FB5|nr:protein Cep78 homolog [Neocloeon triangulifer]
MESSPQTSANFKEELEFKDCYVKYCKDHKISTPTKTLAHQTDPSSLSVNADRMKVSDWEAIFVALQKETLIKKLCVLSSKRKKDWLSSVDENVKSEFAASSVKGPPIFTNYILEKLLTAVVKALLRKESVCEFLKLELPLGPNYCLLFSQGIPGALKLRRLSLSGCSIGDEGCRYICDALKMMPHIRELDLSECNLGTQSVDKIVDLLKCHGLILSTVAWETSFRYRAPKINTSMGLARLTLNKNQEIGDEGAKKLAEALKDDMSLKAIDLQGCKITAEGATSLLGMLHHNKILKLIDVRGNGLSIYMTETITRVLHCKERVAAAKKDDFPVEWLPLVSN